MGHGCRVYNLDFGNNLSCSLALRGWSFWLGPHSSVSRQPSSSLLRTPGICGGENKKKKKKKSHLSHKNLNGPFLTESRRLQLTELGNPTFLQDLQKQRKRNRWERGEPAVKGLYVTFAEAWMDFSLRVNNKSLWTEKALYARDHDDVNYSLLTLKRTLSHREPLVTLGARTACQFKKRAY